MGEIRGNRIIVFKNTKGKTIRKLVIINNKEFEHKAAQVHIIKMGCSISSADMYIDSLPIETKIE